VSTIQSYTAKVHAQKSRIAGILLIAMACPLANPSDQKYGHSRRAGRVQL